MKKFLPFLASMLLASVSWGQTGNGVVLLTDASYTFTPTTVDSSATFNLSLKNDVGIAQTVFFGGLDAPFQLSNDGPIEVASQDTIDFSITFTPSAIGSFSDTLEVIGNVFGSASLVVSGDGIQVQLEWTPDTLAFATTAIGQTNSQILALSSVGDGAAVISSIDFSNDIFSVDSALSSFIIPEGETGEVVINYNPQYAGAVQATMILSTNDPNNTTISIALSGSSVSELSGETCDVIWTVLNSPYTLVGNIVVPDGCNLTIEPGVEVIGPNYDLIINGNLNALGTEDNPILLRVNQFLIQSNLNDSTSLEHVSIEESTPTTWPTWFNGTYGGFWSQNLGSNSHYGVYREDWATDDLNGWSVSGSGADYVYTQNGYLQGSSNYGYGAGSINMQSPSFVMPAFESADNLTFDVNFNWDGNCNAGSYSVSLNVGTPLLADGSENYVLETLNCEENGWTSKSYNLAGYETTGKEISIRVLCSTGNYSVSLSLDNFSLETTSYPETDVDFDAFTSSLHTLLPSNSISFGNVSFEHCTIIGDMIFGGDSMSLMFADAQITSSNPSSNSTGIAVFGDSNSIQLYESFVSGFDRGLISFSGANIEFTGEGLTLENSLQDGIVANTPNGFLDIDRLAVSNVRKGLKTTKSSFIQLYDVLISQCTSHCIDISDNSILNMAYGRLENGDIGIEIGAEGALNLNNSAIIFQSKSGIITQSTSALNHCNVVFNGTSGVVLSDNNFHTLDNSIIWGNNVSNYTQIEISGGVLSSSYSSVQGQSSYGTSGSGQFYWGEGVIEDDPLFSDDDLHLEIFSPCVDGGQPWHQDAYMPFGLGGVRADMGMYGGPDNAYWGGEALPDGASALTGVSDSPQDQGGVVGLVFDASFYDNSDLVNNVTSYAFWRHYDPTGQSIGTLDEGNWELIGEMPAQSFNGYAYQAQTLGNTNAFGTFNSCYTVVAHTDDPDTYWYSNVLCGESVDNLAPVEPELEGMVLETGGVTVFWELPSEEDYAYTEVTSDAGFAAEVTGDTLAVDLSAELGGTYTYTAVHYDVNGNASDPASLTLALEPGVDVITLNAGWNLISTDRAVTQDVDEVFAGLAAGNLQYVTGFDGGVQFYDPNGLSFLNTLGSLTPGNGYWVKIAADDVLEVSGVRLAEDFMPGLAEGWNLVGYAAEAPAAPGDVFAELEATGDLLYVTGFDEGVEVYDPNGLPFLNTLTEMRNGFGYWVKSAVATDGDVLAPLADDVLPAEMPTPRYDVVNGASELGAYAGEFVDVLNGWGVTVARLPILEGGHLMTTALFGDDPATGAVEGLADGEELHFAFRGAMANETLVFDGDMTHKTLSLTFDEVGAAMGVFPNPASDVATFRFQLDMDAKMELTLVDLAGRQVAVLLDANKGAGAHAETLALPALEAGAYTVQLRVAGEVAGTQRLVVVQ